MWGSYDKYSVCIFQSRLERSRVGEIEINDLCSVAKHLCQRLCMGAGHSNPLSIFQSIGSNVFSDIARCSRN